MSIELNSLNQQTENATTHKECGEKHKQRVGNAMLELAIDVSTDFSCDAQ